MTNAKMYLTNEMAEFLIEEFAKNNVAYDVKKDFLMDNGDIVAEITYDQNQHFVGNYIFTAAIAFSNTFINKAKRQVAGEEIINSAINTPKIKVEEVRQLTGNNYFVVTMGDFISTSSYTDDNDRTIALEKVMNLVALLESGKQNTRDTIYESNA
jgi:hypothetical protein